VITFAVVGHNEESSLGDALGLAAAAAGAEDVVTFLDSGSTDGSAALARSLGHAVFPAPIGKGRAMRSLLAGATTPWVCFLDADILAAERNIAAELAAAVHSSPDSPMIVGDFTDRLGQGVLSNTWTVYEPIVAALFPEVSGTLGEHPLTGFRAVRVDAAGPPADLPPTFGVEAHLNVVAAQESRDIPVVHLGWYEGRFAYKPAMGWEIADALLGLALRLERLKPEDLAAWWRWTLEATAVIATYHGHASEVPAFVKELTRLRARSTPAGEVLLPPLPPL
jgi:glycosyltransferase involved in cell wall biosynthesis